MDKPLFSIVIPTYNRAWCIERVIESVLVQNFKNWEVIIVDDGSNDNSKDVIRKYLSDSRIRYFYKENGGVGSARNLGIEHVSGDLVMFIDSDDEFTEDAFDIFVDAERRYKNFEIFILGAADQKGRLTYFMDGDRRPISFEEFISEKYYRGEAYMCFRRIVFSDKEDRFDEEVNGGESIWIFGVFRKYRAIMINKVVRTYHTESSDSLITSNLTLDKMRNISRIQLKLLERYKDDLRKYNKKKLGESYLVLARAVVLTDGLLASVNYFLRGILYSPFDIKRESLYVFSIFDRNLHVNNFLNSVYNIITHK